jgi:hypothetical protein
MSRKEVERLRLGRDTDARRIAALETHAELLEQNLAAERAKAAVPAPAAPPAAAPPRQMTAWETLAEIRETRGPMAGVDFINANRIQLAAEADARRAGR